ncbi:MAG: nicotinate (nicotinamide) nucleotide adenylyltransferase [Bacilli bacterium]|nr:nicotinate (nicotinamide) nucleotide adenylyltransferase [Bacilli bacterium]
MANYILFGGTFDPVHNGHIRIATAASLKLNADVIFIPARSPRWKTPLTSAEHRTKMLKIAMKGTACGSSISDFELKSTADINYSIDTIRYFVKKYPKDKFFFVIGADQVNNFPEWKEAEEISNLTTVVYVSRPNVKLNKQIISTYHMQDLSFLESGEVSSSAFRAMQTLDIPMGVLEYIEKNRLYFIGKLAKYLTEKRLNHSIEVANLALRIAKANKLEHPERYYFAGLLHDVGKTYPNNDEELLHFMKKCYPEYVKLPNFAYHQFMGAKIAHDDFLINDEIILDAIKNHCTGNKNMSDVAMVVYASDKIEPTRGFDSRWLISSCLKDYKQGFIDTLIDNKKYLLSHSKDITNELTDACFDMYLPKGDLK